MRRALFRPLSGAVSPFEAAHAASLVPAHRPRPAAPLPMFVPPVAAEALLSWLLRLASRLGVSLQTLAGESFGIEDPSLESRWWCRPDPLVLIRISDRTGISPAQVRAMTFGPLEPVYRDDEASGRLVGRWFYPSAVRKQERHFAICGLCLEGDSEPYIRTPWLFGWMALCPRHGIRLLTRCRACRAEVRFAPLESTAHFSPPECSHCGKSLLDGDYRLAHPDAAQLQARLLSAKLQGFAEFPGLGRLTWKETIALADVLLGTLWTDLWWHERDLILRQFAQAEGGAFKWADPYLCRHGALCLLAWLLKDWPDSPGATIASELLDRWQNGNRSDWSTFLRARRTTASRTDSDGLHPSVRKRLLQLAPCTIH